MKDEVKGKPLSLRPSSFSLAPRSDVAAARLDGELALRLLDGGRDLELELAHRAVALTVRRDEAHAVARAQVLDERVEGSVEVFGLVVEDFAARLVGEAFDAERADVEYAAHRGRRTHDAVLHALVGGARDETADDAAGLEDLAPGLRAGRPVAVEVARHAR